MRAGEGRVHGLKGGRFLQIYLGLDVSIDSRMPLEAGEDCYVEIVDEAVVVTPSSIEVVDADLTLAERGREREREVKHD